MHNTFELVHLLGSQHDRDFSPSLHQSLTMSSTTTITTQTRTRQNVLKDYEVHHSTPAGPSRSAHIRPALPAPRPQTGSVNPPGWDTTHRRVPEYRSVNSERDQSEVRVYTSTVERVFLGTMFTGVFLNAVSLSCQQMTWESSLTQISRPPRRFGGRRLGGLTTTCSNILSEERSKRVLDECYGECYKHFTLAVTLQVRAIS